LDDNDRIETSEIEGEDKNDNDFESDEDSTDLIDYLSEEEANSDEDNSDEEDNFNLNIEHEDN
jgi:hypothetical protein